MNRKLYTLTTLFSSTVSSILIFDNSEFLGSMASGWSPVAVASVSQNPTEAPDTATRVLGFFYRRISAIKHCRGVMGQPIKMCFFVNFLRVSADDQPLAKEPEDSGYEIGQCKKNVSPIY